MARTARRILGDALETIPEASFAGVILVITVSRSQAGAPADNPVYHALAYAAAAAILAWCAFRIVRGRPPHRSKGTRDLGRAVSGPDASPAEDDAA